MLYKNNKKLRVFALGAVLVFSCHLSAQVKVDTIQAVSYSNLVENYFAGFHFGINGSWGENIRYYKLSDIPRFQRLGGMLSLGKFFSSNFALRGTLGIYRQCGRAEKEPREVYPEYYGDGIYNFWSANANVDVLVNLYHVFYPHRPTPKFNVLPLFGVGTAYTFGFEKDKLEIFSRPAAPYVVNTKADFYPSLRIGFLLSYWLSKRFELQFDAHFDFIDDKYNGVIDDRKYDGYTVAMLGLAYKFNRGTRRFENRFEHLDDAVEVNRMNNELEIARQNLEKAKVKDTLLHVNQEQFLEMTVSFIIDKFNITDVQRPNVEAVAAYINSHPEVDVIICGFADVNTAYPAYNMRLSKRRVMAVYNMLTQQFGVDPDRLSIDYKGDTEQPYDLKYQWNRVVVFKLTPHTEYKEIK